MSKLTNAFKKLFSFLSGDASNDAGENPAEESMTESPETTVETGKAVEEAAVQPAVETVKEKVKAKVEKAKDAVEEIVGKEQQAASQKTRPHAFVVMPFGQKKGADGQIIDFNAIYQELIKPALEEAGFEAFRADEETVSGDILTDMFQELLLADLAICDMSIDNANVFYELGVRHAMRKRGVVHIQSGRAYMPFDIFNVRTVPYHTGDDGKPDINHLARDKQAIIRAARDTWASDQDAVHSPIFNLLTGLTEPDRKSLRTPLATGFWREYNEWKERVTVARRQKRIGDILLLTEEISNPLIKEEAISEAGKALKSMRRHELALEQYRKGLELNSRNLEFRREEALHLNRLGRVDEAIVKLENLLQDEPGDSESIATLGRIYKDMWTEFWKDVEDEQERLKEAYDASHWLMQAIHTYLKGYYSDLRNYYPGINALTLSIILEHLAEQFDEEGDPDIKAIRGLLPQLKGSLQFALEKKAQQENSDYWSLVSLAELLVMTSDDVKKVRRAYKKALTAARKNIFNLQSSLAQLGILESLSLRFDFVQVAKKVLQDEINHIQQDEPEEDAAQKKPDKEEVFLFKGHKIDIDEEMKRPFPLVKRRFPPEKEEVARKYIDAALDKFSGSDNDLAITAGAACGGDIIFIEACLERGMKVDIHLPFSEPDYIKEEISPGGDQWVERYYALRNHANVTIHIQSDHVGKVKDGDDPYKRNNRWALSSSLIRGIDRLHLIALWDGQTHDAQDRDGQLVSHMVREMRHIGGCVEHLNTTKFSHPQFGNIKRKVAEKQNKKAPEKKP